MEVQLYDPRPNGELLLATGSVPDVNPAQHLLWPAALIQADRYYGMKAQVGGCPAGTQAQRGPHGLQLLQWA